MRSAFVKRTLSIFAFLVTLILAISSISIFADSSQEIRYKELSIVIMPEYNLHPDKNVAGPNLLIGYHGTIVNESNKSISDIEIPIPAHEKNFQISLVASPTTEDEEAIDELKYTINKNNDSLTITFNEAIQPSGTAKFMIEYFYTPIKVANGQKTFDYAFKASDDAELVNVMLFEPLGAENFVATPASDKQATDTMGVKMHLYEYKNLQAGEEKQYRFTYIKKNDETTIQQVEKITSKHSEFTNDLENTAAEQSANNKKGSFNGALAVALGLVVLIIGVFSIWYWKRTKQRKQETQFHSEHDKKELRKLLAEGKINEKQYAEQLSKLE